MQPRNRVKRYQSARGHVISQAAEVTLLNKQLLCIAPDTFDSLAIKSLQPRTKQKTALGNVEKIWVLGTCPELGCNTMEQFLDMSHSWIRSPILSAKPDGDIQGQTLPPREVQSLGRKGTSYRKRFHGLRLWLGVWQPLTLMPLRSLIRWRFWRPGDALYFVS